MILQLKIENSQSRFFLDLLKNLNNTVKQVTILDETEAEVVNNPKNDFFEITGLDGIEYRVPNWTDEEFREFAIRAMYENDDTEVEFE
jgi:hypothetical protein